MAAVKNAALADGDAPEPPLRAVGEQQVVDEADRDTAGLPGQLLFVSDFADGLGTGAAGDNDTVEILDQKVRASYQVSRCAAASARSPPSPG